MAEFVTIARFYQVVEADAARLALEHAGIDSHFEGVNLVAADFLLSNAVGGVKLLVAENDVSAAEQVLNVFQRALEAARTPSQAPLGDIAFRCSECGESIRFAAEMAGKCEVCPRCHEYVDVPEAGTPEALVATLPDVQSHATNPFGEASGRAELTQTEPPAKPSGGDWLEVIVVLLTYYFPHFFWGIQSFSTDDSYDSSDYQVAWSANEAWDYAQHIVFSTSIIALVLYILWRNGEPWSTIGVRPIRWIRDVALGVVCLVIEQIASVIGWLAIFSTPGPRDFLMTQFDASATTEFPALAFVAGVFIVAGTFASAYAEELLYRGYLIKRLEVLLSARWMAVFVSALLFGAVHMYQGVDGAVSAFLNGLIFGLLFLWLRRLWPLVLAHMGFNLWVTFG